MSTVFTAIEKLGHDEDFIPTAGSDFFATGAPAGSIEKIEVLRQRVEKGQPLWHPGDRTNYNGLPAGIVRPREKTEHSERGMSAIAMPNRKRAIGDDY